MFIFVHLKSKLRSKMKNILMCLAFVIVSAMGETDYKLETIKTETTEIEKQLSQEERFNMLFGKTGLNFNEIRKSRANRSTRNSRKIVSKRLVTDVKIVDASKLTYEERYELLFGKAIPSQRIARTTRLIFPRHARQSLYVTLNF